MNITTTLSFVDRAIEAYNKIYNASITPSNINTLVIDAQGVFINDKVVGWEQVRFK